MRRLLRSITDRLRGGHDSPGGREQRASPRLPARHELRLLYSVSVLDARTRGGSGSGPLALTGRTRDISLTGLALVVPSLRGAGHDLSGSDCALLIELELPSGPIRFMAMPVRHEPLEGEGQEEGGYLIGVRITQIGGDARARLAEYLRGASRG